MKHLAIILILMFCQSIKAEYKWTGSEWQWVEPEREKGPVLAEGSGGGQDWEDDEDYDYNGEYDYKDDKDLLKGAGGGGGGGGAGGGGAGGGGGGKIDDFSSIKTPKVTKPGKANNNKKKEKGGKNKNIYTPVNSNPVGGFTDDEDFREGSGDIDAGPSDPWDNEAEGSGGFYSSIPSPQIPSRTTEKVSTTTTTTTESPLSNVNGGVVDPFGVDDPSEYGDYNEDEDDEYDYEEKETSPASENVPSFDDNPPFDDEISIDEPTSKTTEKTTTTLEPFVPVETTDAPRNIDTPIISDIPTNRPVSFFAQPGILAAVIGGAVVGLLCAILLVMFIVYRMRKKDEGSYILDEPKRVHNGNLYTKTPNREFYA